MLNFWAIILATLAAFVASSLWYILLGRQLIQISPAMADMKKAPTWKKLVVVAQSFVLAIVVAYIIGRTGVNSWLGSVWIGALLWVGLSAVQWVGSIIWENVPVKLAAIHAGDWLVKLVLISAIIGVWR